MLFNDLEYHAECLRRLVDRLQIADAQIDQRWVIIGATDLQTGLMALRRSIEKKPPRF